MKRSLVVIGLLFLILWVTCLFFQNKTSSIHIALLVGLVFFSQHLMTKPKPVVTEDQDANVQFLKNKEEPVVTEALDTDVQL